MVITVLISLEKEDYLLVAKNDENLQWMYVDQEKILFIAFQSLEKILIHLSERESLYIY